MTWQPIETAPKDGTKFDAWADGGYRITGVFWNGTSYSVAWWNREYEIDCTSPLASYDALTHWMPLPAPPPSD